MLIGDQGQTNFDPGRSTEQYFLDDIRTRVGIHPNLHDLQRFQHQSYSINCVVFENYFV